ncbi:hypothetical protein AYI70_g2397 [Smittium culicis]|uniref:Uncharacterized protein n=1 Tax=Smittium culicis TaxID=133412 RepID=A0A1R1Y975_9FUNG|nr:hypothetical protein AYI70_g2397 [Smittium culicis]
MYVILVAMFATIFKFRITYAATAFTPYRRSKYTTALAASIPTKILILWSFANFTHPFPSNLQFLLATDCAGFPATTTTGLDPIEPFIDSGRVPMPAPPIPAATTSRLLAAASAGTKLASPPPVLLMLLLLLLLVLLITAFALAFSLISLFFSFSTSSRSRSALAARSSACLNSTST